MSEGPARESPAAGSATPPKDPRRWRWVGLTWKRWLLGAIVLILLLIILLSIRVTSCQPPPGPDASAPKEEQR